jgi:hypothetical protein
MTELPFSIDLIRALAEHRTGLLTAFLLATTFVGDVGGYVVGIAALAVKYEDAIQRRWSELSSSQQVLSLVGASALLWSITVALNGWTIGEQPRAFLSYTGFLTGSLVGHGLETTHVSFDPRSSTVVLKLLRYAVSVAAVLTTLLALDPLLELLAADSSALGHALR